MSTFKLGFHLRGDGDPRKLLDVFAAASRLGFDGGWVGAHLSSPLVFLGAAAVRAPGLRLGAVAATFAHPLRMAEDAAVLDAFSGGLLELGVDEPDAVRAALRGEVRRPPVPALADRIWRRAADTGDAARVGRDGDGLLTAERRIALAYADTARRPRFAVPEPGLVDLLNADSWFLPEITLVDVDVAVEELSRVATVVAPALGWRR
ncbi:LLM class flavin-dependent oxidoreductase [Actinosynnema sp. NPDC023587]|uniref:LLM class flavin-dependent oxidoreductase n=1 Tax=Actinosynnema sp. NPDC023587 TaxID=3154695 RepID=UPI00340F6044